MKDFGNGITILDGKRYKASN